MSLPLVTGIMVTGKDPARKPFALAAVRSFLAQSWPNKELVIINDGCPLKPEIDDSMVSLKTLIHEHMFAAGERTLGELRNEGLEAANGEWAIQWDDDDWSHCTRIAVQMDVAKDGHAVLLKNQIRYSFPNDSAIDFRWPYKPNPAIPGTVLHPVTDDVRYRAARKAEDDFFLQDHFKTKMIVVDNVSFPHAYIRFFTGHNTWDHRHVMQQYADPAHRGKWAISAPAAEYLRNVLAEYYGFANA